MLPPYVSPRRRDAPKDVVPNNEKTPPIVPFIPKVVKVVKNILPNVQKIAYADHDTKTQLDLDCRNYMYIMQDTSEAPQ